MKSLLKKSLLALSITLGCSFAYANPDIITWPDPSGGTWLCQISTGVCVLLESSGPIDP